MEEEEAQRRRNELRMNARKLKEMRGSECEVSSNE